MWWRASATHARTAASRPTMTSRLASEWCAGAAPCAGAPPESRAALPARGSECLRRHSNKATKRDDEGETNAAKCNETTHRVPSQQHKAIRTVLAAGVGGSCLSQLATQLVCRRVRVVDLSLKVLRHWMGRGQTSNRDKTTKKLKGCHVNARLFPLKSQKCKTVKRNNHNNL